MGFGDMTNYNKERMESLSQEIKRDKERYNELVNALQTKINEMHNHWVEDPAAEAVYQQLLTQFNTDSSFNYSGYYNPTSNYIKGTYKIYKATNDTYLLLLISDEVVKDGTKTTGFNYSLNTIIINDDNLQLGESYTCKRSTSLY
mgnify:CR=1 FL=1